MSLEDSPSFDEISSDFSDEQPDFDKGDRRSGPKIFILLLVGLGLILALVNFAKSDQYAILMGKGSISGHAVDADGQPIQVEVFVFGADIEILSDENGYFSIQGLPRGEQSIIVAYGDIATEVMVDVEAGMGIDIGTVRVPTDIEPG